MKSGDGDAADALMFDYRNAALTAEQRALCDYAVKLTLVPGQCGQADVDRLRGHGFDDAQITLAAQVISYFNYINRIADGLGVDAEESMASLPREQWHARKAQDYASVLDGE